VKEVSSGYELSGVHGCILFGLCGNKEYTVWPELSVQVYEMGCVKVIE
jgi:hypothetical protein